MNEGAYLPFNWEWPSGKEEINKKKKNIFKCLCCNDKWYVQECAQILWPFLNKDPRIDQEFAVVFDVDSLRFRFSLTLNTDCLNSITNIWSAEPWSHRTQRKDHSLVLIFSLCCLIVVGSRVMLTWYVAAECDVGRPPFICLASPLRSGHSVWV